MTPSSYTSANMSARLWDASNREARFIVENYTTSDDHLALKVALSIGLATEYLIMSALSSLDVALLADDKSPYSKLALSKVKAGNPIDARRLRTVVYGSAVKLLVQHNQFIQPSDVDTVMNVRNAAAHMAMVSKAGNAEGLTTMLTIVEGLHKYLDGINEDDYWGPDCVAVVRNLRDEHANKLKVDYDGRVLAAKAKLRALEDGISATEREHVLSVLEQRLATDGKALDPDLQTAHSHACPACGRMGITTWDRSLQDDFEYEETYESATGSEAPALTVSVAYDAVAFACLVCGLNLGRDGVAIMLDNATYYPGEERYVLSDQERNEYYESFGEQVR
ncbi:hypothetical protein [Clavibacter tessellarius]|uniref:hypothetical protein n=1 Tax=Clavibacter tessellarius TaxID=31965 RepID=UPI0032499E61